jgi:CheY-like chemotaxis protein
MREKRVPASMETNANETALSILVVDDDALVLMSTCAMLEDLGHTVFEATSGKQALGILEGGAHVDLVITDQAMPDMSGLQLALELESRWPRLPIVLATGYSDLPEGSPPYPMLGKPFNEDDLARTIREALQRG